MHNSFDQKQISQRAVGGLAGDEGGWAGRGLARAGRRGAREGLGEEARGGREERGNGARRPGWGRLEAGWNRARYTGEGLLGGGHETSNIFIPQLFFYTST